MVDFTPIRDAKLGPEDLRKLCGVSRVACSMWLNNHTQPHHLLTDRVQKVVDGVKAALDAGLLPVPFSVVRRERGFYIQQAVEKAAAQAAE
jgi:molybdenum cofactor biosynthesis enzyme MoaA